MVEITINGRRVCVSPRLERIIRLLVRYAAEIDATTAGSLEIHLGANGQIKPKLHKELADQPTDQPIDILETV